MSSGDWVILTPFSPSPFQGEGEIFTSKRGLAPLFNTPIFYRELKVAGASLRLSAKIPFFKKGF